MSQPIETYTEPVKLELSNMVIRMENGVWEIEVGGLEQPRWFATGESVEEAIASLVKAVSEDAIQDEARAWEEGEHQPLMFKELAAHIATLTVTSDSIGAIRARLLMPFDCEWNGWVRDLTAERENREAGGVGH